MPREIQRDEVQRLMQGGVQLVDVLPHADYEQFHLPGAINIPLEKLGHDSAERLEKEKPTVTYCHDTQ